MSDANMAPRVLMVFPKFYENSMWNFKEAMELQGARAPAPPLGLITLAALAADPNVAARAGAVLHAGDLARIYGFTDADGTQPERFRVGP